MNYQDRPRELTAANDAMYARAVAAFQAEDYTLDPLIDSPEDDRYGITLLCRPSAEVQQEILGFLEELRTLEPDQYYYPASDLHVTVLSIISCYPGFQLSQIGVPDYAQIIRECLAGLPPFTLQFRGIRASPAGVMVQASCPRIRCTRYATACA